MTARAEKFCSRVRGSAQVSLTHESVSGERWAPGIETLGSQSTGEANRRAFDDAVNAVVDFIATHPGKGSTKATALSEGVS